MTPNEFKAWFDGFTEAFDKTPSQKQWARIKERVAEIDGKPVTEKVFVDRYWPQYIRPWVTPPYYGAPFWSYLGQCQNTAGSRIGASGMDGANNAIQAAAYQSALSGKGQFAGGDASNYVSAQGGETTAVYDSRTAMAALGRAEAQAMSQ